MVGKNNADHLVAALKGKYKISEDWSVSLYCDNDLEWDYMARNLDLGMPGYIKTQLQLYKNSKPTRPPALPAPCGAEALRQERTKSNPTR